MKKGALPGAPFFYLCLKAIRDSVGNAIKFLCKRSGANSPVLLQRTQEIPEGSRPAASNSIAYRSISLNICLLQRRSLDDAKFISHFRFNLASSEIGLEIRS